MVNIHAAKSSLKNLLNDALDEQRRMERNPASPVPQKDALGEYIDALQDTIEKLNVYETEM